MSKRIDMQPWLDYFELLQTYIEKGYLEVYPRKGEAYITESALNTLSNVDDPKWQLDDRTLEAARRLRAYTTSLRHIRTYAGWLGQDGKIFLDKPFALHIVKDMQPYDFLCTILLTVRRRWWALWCKTDCIEVIPYNHQKPTS